MLLVSAAEQSQQRWFSSLSLWSKWSMRRRRTGKKMLFGQRYQICQKTAPISHEVTQKAVKWLVDPGECVRDTERGRDTSISGHVRETFSCQTSHWKGPAASPHVNAAESEIERKAEAEKQKETDIWSIRGVWQTRNYQKKSLWARRTTHHCPDSAWLT